MSCFRVFVFVSRSFCIQLYFTADTRCTILWHRGETYTRFLIFMVSLSDPIYFRIIIYIQLYIQHHRKCSQSQYRKTVIYSTLLQPTFSKCAASIVLATVISMAWYQRVMQHFLAVYHVIPRFSNTGDSQDIPCYATQMRCRSSIVQKEHLTYRHARRIVSDIGFDKEIFPSKSHKAPGRNFSTQFSYWCGCGFRSVDFVRRCSRSNSEPLPRDTPCRLTWRTYSSICTPFALGSCIAGSTFHQNLE